MWGWPGAVQSGAQDFLGGLRESEGEGARVCGLGSVGVGQSGAGQGAVKVEPSMGMVAKNGVSVSVAACSIQVVGPAPCTKDGVQEAQEAVTGGGSSSKWRILVSRRAEWLGGWPDACMAGPKLRDSSFVGPQRTNHINMAQNVNLASSSCGHSSWSPMWWLCKQAGGKQGAGKEQRRDMGGCPGRDAGGQAGSRTSSLGGGTLSSVKWRTKRGDISWRPPPGGAQAAHSVVSSTSFQKSLVRS